MCDRHIIIFDGVCNFCNGAVNFIIKRDREKVFVFAPIQSSAAQELLAKHHIETGEPNTLVLIKDSQCFTRTDAVLEITSDLSGAWRLLKAFKLLPRPVRDGCYRRFALHRYRWFGRRESCMVPAPEQMDRFLE